MKTLLKFIVISLSLFNLCNSQLVDSCSLLQPTTATDCHTLTNSNFFCCFSANDVQSSKSCVSLEQSKYKSSSITFHQGVGQNLDCGIGILGQNTGDTFNHTLTTAVTNNNTLQLNMDVCGTRNPKEKKQCSDYSMLGNSCCFYTTNTGVGTGCYYLGQRYVGNATYSGYTIDCSAGFLTIGKYMMMVVAIIALFL
jgi:hypothetical protein